MIRLSQLAAGFVLAFATLAVQADINVGITLSATGPAASLGIPKRNAVALLPTTVAGQKINYIVRDDASDTTAAVRNARKFITEDKVDIVIGSTTTPNSLATIDVVAESETPMISMAASKTIVEPVEGKRRWIFKTPQNDAQMATALVSHMLDNKIKTVAFIGFADADAYGEGWAREFGNIAELRGLKAVAGSNNSMKVH